MINKARQEVLDSIERPEGEKGELPDKFSEMKLEKFLEEQKSISKSIEDLTAKIDLLPKYVKKESWW